MQNISNNKSYNKFKYELKFRKKEYLNICLSKDYSLKGIVNINDFFYCMKKFSVYLNDDDINELILLFHVNELIHYMDITNYNSTFNDIYVDEYLIHKNKLVINNENANNSKSEYKNLINNLDNNQQEDNFKIKIAKLIKDYVILNQDNINVETKNKEFEFSLNLIFDNNDTDKDGYLTIGELNILLINCNINLANMDLIFLFEYLLLKNTMQNNGKIKKEFFNKFVLNYSSKSFQYNLLCSSNKQNMFTYKNKYELEEDKYLKSIEDNCFIFDILKDALTIIGKTYIMNYFDKYYYVENNIKYLEINILEIGLKNLGYDTITNSEIGSFKYYCIKKSLCKDDYNYNSIQIEFEKLLNYLLNNIHKDKSLNFKKEKDLSFINNQYLEEINSKDIIESNNTEFINNINALFFKDIANMFLKKTFDNTLTTVMDSNNNNNNNNNNNKYLNKINEVDFRRQFINAFDIIDHRLMDYYCEFLDDRTPIKVKPSTKQSIDFNKQVIDSLISKNNFINNNETIIKSDLDFNMKVNNNNNKMFNLLNVCSKKWIQLSYNFLFYGLIKNISQLGIFINDEDIKELNIIADRMLVNLFPIPEDLIKSINSKLSFKLKDRINVDKSIKLNLITSNNENKNKVNNSLDKSRFNKIVNKKEIQENNVKSTSINKQKLEYNEVFLKDSKSKLNNNSNNNKEKLYNSLAGKNIYQNNNIKDNIINDYNINKIYSIKYKKKIDTCDSICKLHKLCSDYLINKFNFNKNKTVCSTKELFDLGVCLVFRDMLENNANVVNNHNDNNDKLYSPIGSNFKAVDNSINLIRFIKLCEQANIDSDIISLFYNYFKQQKFSINYKEYVNSECNIEILNIDLSLVFLEIESLVLEYSKLLHNKT